MERKLADENRYRYCCGCFHVQRGAYVLGAIGVVFGAIGVVFTLVVIIRLGANVLNVGHVLLSVLNTLVCLGLILAQHRRQPNLYLPYLFVTAAGIVILVACVCFAFVVFVQNDDDFERMLLLLYGALFTAGAALDGWLWRMVYLAYDFMKLQLHDAIANSCPPPNYYGV